MPRTIDTDIDALIRSLGASGRPDELLALANTLEFESSGEDRLRALALAGELRRRAAAAGRRPGDGAGRG